MSRTPLLIAAATVALVPAALRAETELGFYLGSQSALDSDVSVEDPVIGQDDFSASWDGNSFEAPPYYGFRATWWREDDLGFGLDFTHSKIYADGDTRGDNGYDVLEFTDGLNILTFNAYKRFPDAVGGLTPYFGGGLGISVPHVEVEKDGSETTGYQYGGPAATVIAGASYPISDQWAVFGEYKGTYSRNEVDLDSGGSLETDVKTNAVNLGVSFSF